VNSAGVLPAFRLYLRADARLEKGAEFFFSRTLSCCRNSRPPANLPIATPCNSTQQPPSIAHLLSSSLCVAKANNIKTTVGGEGKMKQKI